MPSKGGARGRLNPHERDAFAHYEFVLYAFAFAFANKSVGSHSIVVALVPLSLVIHNDGSLHRWPQTA